MNHPHPIRCRCGTFQAEVDQPRRGVRVVCYCRDCQCFAHYLGSPGMVLDAMGGTDVVAVAPRHVRFISGVEQLACMSLSPRGTLRWYARCCRTAIGNTPRDVRQSHLGLIHACLARPGTSLDAAFGPVRMRVNRHGAHGQPAGAPVLGFATALIGYLGTLAWSRISGSYRQTPFFDAAGRPRVEPHVVSRIERAALLKACESGADADPLAGGRP